MRVVYFPVADDADPARKGDPMKSSNLVSRTALALALSFGMAAPLVASANAGPDASVAPQEGRGECGHGRHGRRHHGMHKMFAELNLTDAQKAQMKMIREEARERMRAVLTAEQRAKFDAKREAMKKKWEGKRSGRSGA